MFPEMVITFAKFEDGQVLVMPDGFWLIDAIELLDLFEATPPDPDREY